MVVGTAFSPVLRKKLEQNVEAFAQLRRHNRETVIESQLPDPS